MWVEHSPLNTHIDPVSPELKRDAWQFIQGLNDGPRALRKLGFSIIFFATHFSQPIIEQVEADRYG